MKEACFGNLLDGFGMFFRIIWLDILQTVFITLWSLLFIVPGIIAEYRYRLALYLLLDHPEMSAMDCIRESKRIMSGNKGQLFVLDLSFIGWWILAGIPIVGLFVRVWVVPYTQMTYALYYTTLTGTNAPAQFRETAARRTNRTRSILGRTDPAEINTKKTVCMFYAGSFLYNPLDKEKSCSIV